MLLERDMNGQKLIEEMDTIMLNPVLLKEMKEASKKLGIPDAAMRLYNVMKEVINNKKK